MLSYHSNKIVVFRVFPDFFLFHFLCCLSIRVSLLPAARLCLVAHEGARLVQRRLVPSRLGHGAHVVDHQSQHHRAQTQTHAAGRRRVSVWRVRIGVGLVRLVVVGYAIEMRRLIAAKQKPNMLIIIQLSSRANKNTLF